VQAKVGAIAKSIGATAASSYPIIRASGLIPLDLAASSDIRIRVHAPSLSLLELAVVIVPFLAKTGFSPTNLSGKNLTLSSSTLIIRSAFLSAC